MADCPSRRMPVRPPCPGVVGRGTMDDRRQPGGGATIVAAPGGGRRAARGGRSSAGTSYLYLLLYSCSVQSVLCSTCTGTLHVWIDGAGLAGAYTD